MTLNVVKHHRWWFAISSILVIISLISIFMKGFNFGFLITARFGGIVLSQTQAILDSWGVSKRTADARNNGGIEINGGKISAENYYRIVGGDNPIWSEYIYSATNARLQEAHIGYTIPKKWIKGMELSLGLTANNLFFISCFHIFIPVNKRKYCYS